MPACPKCQLELDVKRTCPQCGVPWDSPFTTSTGDTFTRSYRSTDATYPLKRRPLSNLASLSLILGIFISGIGVIASLIGGIVLLCQGRMGEGLLAIFVTAPYSFAMVTVFNRTFENGA